MFSRVWLSWIGVLVTLATWTACGVAECNCKKNGNGVESKIPAGVRNQFQRQKSGTGEYSSGHDKGSEDAAGHFRHEERLDDGSVRGRYGYTDSNGLQKVVEYFADESGFHILHVKIQAPSQNSPAKATDHPEPFSPFLGVLPPFVPKYKSDVASDGHNDFAVNEI